MYCRRRALSLLQRMSLEIDSSKTLAGEPAEAISPGTAASQKADLQRMDSELTPSEAHLSDPTEPALLLSNPMAAADMESDEESGHPASESCAPSKWGKRMRCGTNGCTKTDGHAGLCDLPSVNRTSRKRTKPAWVLRREAEEAPKSAETCNYGKVATEWDRWLASLESALLADPTLGVDAMATTIAPPPASPARGKPLRVTPDVHGPLFGATGGGWSSPLGGAPGADYASCLSGRVGETHGASAVQLPSATAPPPSLSAWHPPAVGDTTLVARAGQGGEPHWCTARVRSHSPTHGTFTVCGDGLDACDERLAWREEGKAWRRVMPRRGEAIEVEVEEVAGTIEWRRAHVVRRLFATGEFTTVVCFADGTPDTDFVETFRVDAEGGEWRRRAPAEVPAEVPAEAPQCAESQVTR